MKYQKMRGNVADADYDKEEGNPFLEALPVLLGKPEFIERIKSDIQLPYDLQEKNPQVRRNYLTELNTWFQPMDYMYTLYDMIYRAMAATYQTKTVVESVRQLNEIYMDFRTGMERTLSYSTQAYCGAVLGVPGIGKTSTIQRCLSIMPQVILHTKYHGQSFYTKQINYLIVECPSDCSVKTLAFNILSAIDRAICTEYFTQAACLRNVSSSALTTRLKIICMNHHIGLIVIDEIQNAILTAAKNKQTRPLIKFLVELTNETSTGICFCGTLEAEELFLKQEHLKRRTRGFRLLPLKYDITYRKFITDLWVFQTTLQKTELTEKLMKQIYDLSAGIPAYILKIFEEAQIQSILSGKEKLTYESMKQAVTYLGIEVPKVYSRGGTSISDFTVQEVTKEEIGVEELDELEVEYPRTEEIETQITTVPIFPDQADIPTEHTEMPVKRFYASQRGRKSAVRDNTDLIAIWKKNESVTHLIQTLKICQMVERRSFLC
ncbi:ATP-binding protein [Lacrimispora amygdalina]|uniref:ATP-binding protein n=1 Tax=Lacrimispora amygdalina TaxID=253257 RepID=UPI000BE48FF2|nr:ATP-binding protein [Lacrimispora amygdalina]